MPRDYIKVDRTTSTATHAQLMLNFRNAVRVAYALGVELRAIMRHNFDDSDPQNINWSDVEALCGLPTGKGADVFTLVDGAVGAMEGQFQTPAAKDLTETLG